MLAKLYRVGLTQDEREHLLGITRLGKSSGREVKRSLILCKADEDFTDQQVAEALMVGPARWAGCGSVSWKEGWSAPSMTCHGRGNGANLMGSKKPTWWPWPAAHPLKGTPGGLCDYLPTKRWNWS